MYSLDRNMLSKCFAKLVLVSVKTAYTFSKRGQYHALEIQIRLDGNYPRGLQNVPCVRMRLKCFIRCPNGAFWQSHGSIPYTSSL